MASFRPILGELAGSIGNNTWSHNKGGAYVRRRSIPTNPNSTRQQDTRTALQLASSAWRNLAPEEAASWNAWAALNPVLNRFGEAVQLTGQQAFVMLNSRIIGAGVNSFAITTAPITGNPPPLLSLTAANETPTDEISVTWTATPLGAGIRLYAWWSGWVSENSDPNIRQSRLLGAGTAADASPSTFTIPVPSLTGDTRQANVWVATMTGDGLISAYLKARVIPVAP